MKKSITNIELIYDLCRTTSIYSNLWFIEKLIVKIDKLFLYINMIAHLEANIELTTTLVTLVSVQIKKYHFRIRISSQCLFWLS